MVYNNRVIGKNISLRSVTIDDAPFILKLRLDDSKNKYVHAVENNLEKEKEWIRKQQKADGDYFFSIIRNSSNELVGNISIYNIDYEKGIAELGRWMSLGASIENVESTILAHDFAFQILGLKRVYTKTMQENKKVVSFWKHFGGDAESNKEIEGMLFYYNTVNREDYENHIRNQVSRVYQN